MNHLPYPSAGILLQVSVGSTSKYTLSKTKRNIKDGLQVISMSCIRDYIAEEKILPYPTPLVKTFPPSSWGTNFRVYLIKNK